MKLSIGSDHGGYLLKEALKAGLLEWDPAISIIDRGTHSLDSVDYPEFSKIVGHDVASTSVDFGILICTTGIGVSVAANKIKGVRAAPIHSEHAAEFSRKHNHLNIICFGGNYDTPYMALRLTKIFLQTQPESGRHQKRVNLINDLENDHD